MTVLPVRENGLIDEFGKPIPGTEANAPLLVFVPRSTDTRDDALKLLQARFEQGSLDTSILTAQSDPDFPEFLDSLHDNETITGFNLAVDTPTGTGGHTDARLTQGVRNGENRNSMVFEEAKIPDANAAQFTLTPLGADSNVVLKFSQDDVPSDILGVEQFKKAFSLPAAADDNRQPTQVIVGISAEGNEILFPDTTGDAIGDFLNYPNKPKPRLQMTINVPPEGVTIKDPGFFSGDVVTKRGVVGKTFQADRLLGLDKNTHMGSVFLDVTSGAKVRVEVGDRTRTNPQGALTFKADDWMETDDDPNSVHNKPGLISVQAPEDPAPAEGPLKIESAGPLEISAQDLASVETSGELVFSNAKLNAGQEIAVSAPKRIRFENSSQLAAVTAVIMQGGGTAALEVVNSMVNSPNGQILMDQFDRITVESATLMASVIRARVVSPSGVLQINNSTLNARELLRLYAEGSSGMVEFNGTVRLTGKKIDIAGNTVRVNSGGTVNTAGNTMVYANGRPITITISPGRA